MPVQKNPYAVYVTSVHSSRQIHDEIQEAIRYRDNATHRAEREAPQARTHPPIFKADDFVWYTGDPNKEWPGSGGSKIPRYVQVKIGFPQGLQRQPNGDMINVYWVGALMGILFRRPTLSNDGTWQWYDSVPENMLSYERPR